MKILYLIKQDIDETARILMEEHQKSNQVTIIDIRKEKDYNYIVDAIESNDKVISW